MRFERKTGNRSIQKVLIVCEGTQTEPNYFKAFDVNRNLLRLDVLGLGRSKLSLVKAACEDKRKAEHQGVPYAHVWCVLDRDAQPSETRDRSDFKSALQKARAHKIQLAYSNDCFELWYVLHFNFHNAAWHRSQYIDKLSKLLNKKYVKNDPAIYKQLLNKQKIAIRNAKKLMADKRDPESDNPSTNVHCLVEFLNAYLTE